MSEALWKAARFAQRHGFSRILTDDVRAIGLMVDGKRTADLNVVGPYILAAVAHIRREAEEIESIFGQAVVVELSRDRK